MRKLSVLILCLFLRYGVFAKQYIYTINAKTTIIQNALKIKEDCDKVLFDLIIKGYTIEQVIPCVHGGCTVGYTIIYKDNK